VVLAVAIAIGAYLCFRLAIPFLPALAWALALAVLFAPLQRWLEAKLRRPSLAAAVAVLLIGLIVLVPAVFVLQQLVLQAAAGATQVQATITSGEWRQVLDARPRLAGLADRVQQHVDLPGAVTTLASWLSGRAASLVKGSAYQVVGFFLTLYLLFFLLRDRLTALQSLRLLSPLSDGDMDRLFERVSSTIHATVYGTLAVAAAQGLLGGLMFWWLGLSAPLLWGVVMALLAIVPVLGAFVVWVPAAVVLALEGSWGKALILVLWGGLVVGTIDNLLRPILVGKRLEQHTILAFMSVVGGLLLFGPAGLILGPVTLTVTTVLLEAWPSRDPAEAKTSPE
jgi:predicted PurR-regulated permease PerM